MRVRFSVAPSASSEDTDKTTPPSNEKSSNEKSSLVRFSLKSVLKDAVDEVLQQQQHQQLTTSTSLKERVSSSGSPAFSREPSLLKRGRTALGASTTQPPPDKMEDEPGGGHADHQESGRAQLCW